MIDPIATAPFAPQNTTRTELYLDEGKQALHSSTDANAENVVKQGGTQQSDISNAQQSQDTVDISDEAKALLQKSVNEPQKHEELRQNLNQQNAQEQNEKKAKEAEESIKAGPSQGTEEGSNAKNSIDKLREMLKEAQNELQEAMKQLQSAQGKARNTTIEQEKSSANAEVELAQQQVLTAQQKVQIIQNQILEAEKGMA